MLKAWKELDEHRRNSCTKSWFLSKLTEWKYPSARRETAGKPATAGELNHLFKVLLGPGKHALTLAQLDPNAANAKYRGDDNMHEDMHSVRVHMIKQQRTEREELERLMSTKNLGAKNLKGFKSLLKRRYGNLWRAWRTGMDNDSNKRLSFVEFCQCCRSVGYFGNIKELWNEMDDDKSGFISLNEIDTEIYQLIADFKVRCHEVYGSMMEAWLVGFDPKQRQRVEVQDFVRVCVKELNLFADRKGTQVEERDYTGHSTVPKKTGQMIDGQVARITKLFNLMLLENRSYMNITDFDAEVEENLIHEDYREIAFEQKHGAHSEVSMRREESKADNDNLGANDSGAAAGGAATHRSQSPKSPRRGPMEMTFEERMHDTFRRQLQFAKGVAKERDLDVKAFRIFEMEDLAPDTAQEFMALLKRKYGSVCRGWRCGLCSSADQMRLSFVEFCQAARDQGYNGNLKSLWLALDRDGSGHITLSDLDPVAHEAVEGFKGMLEEKYGNILEAWNKGLDVNHNGRLDVSYD